MKSKLTDGSLIYGGELEEQDPYATRKRDFYRYLALDSPQDIEEKKLKKQKEDTSTEALLKKLMEDKKKEYGL